MRRTSRIIGAQTSGTTCSSSARTLSIAGLEHARDAVHRNRVRGVAAAGRVVDDDRDRRVGQLELARERRFRHSGHADQRRAVALQAVDLGGGLEPRPGHGAIDAAVRERDAGRARRGEARARAAPARTDA